MLRDRESLRHSLDLLGDSCATLRFPSPVSRFTLRPPSRVNYPTPAGAHNIVPSARVQTKPVQLKQSTPRHEPLQEHQRSCLSVTPAMLNAIAAIE